MSRDMILDQPNNLASMSTARRGVATAALSGKLFAIGGKNTSEVVLKSVEIFDPVSGSWDNGVPLPNVRQSGTAISIGSKIYLIGGHDGISSVSEALSFDFESNQWSNVALYLHALALTVLIIVFGR